MKLRLVWYQPPPEMKVLWSDGVTARCFEDQIQIEKFAVSLFAYAEWAYRWGIQREYECQVERKRKLEERIRKEREEVERKERARIEKAAAERRDRLLSDATTWRRASEIRAYVEAQIARWSADADAETLSRLQTWAEADAIDPLGGGKPPALVQI